MEVLDAGPDAEDRAYSGGALPNLRFGHHFLGGNPEGPDIKAHAFVPSSSIACGLCGDVHFDDGDIFAIATPRPPESPDPAFSFLGILTHEIGHALGLGHTELTAANVSVMHPSVQFDFPTIESASLFADDILGIQSLYGVGMGTVTPVPEPSSTTGLLIASLGLALYDPRRRQRSAVRIDGSQRYSTKATPKR